MDDIVSNVSDRIESEIDESVDDFTSNTEITQNELRELRGILNVKGNSGEKVEFLRVESDHWKKEANKVENDAGKAKLYKAIAKTADLKADEIRLRLNQRPKSEEVINRVKEEAEANDLTRFERFKKWARENITGISVVTISMAGIITSVVMGARNAIKQGAKATSRFGKAVANLAKKFGPVAAALGNLLVKIITLGAKGIAFLSKNLWILALALTYFIYNEYKSRK